MKILILDNYDSFTYNLVQLVEEITGDEVVVIKNDEIDLESIPNYDGVILSPGPGIPEEAGKLLEVIKQYSSSVPMLGVCLGHQAMVEAYGGKLKQLEKVQHGIGVNLKLQNAHSLYEDATQPIQVGRYHSWVVDEEHLPEGFEVTSTDENGIIMSFYHQKYPMVGVQYHPESILTPDGKVLLQNWINSIKQSKNRNNKI
ncbi:aminodeoxychorismate/anthranilate synthase component II [Flavobacteriaceae bacterium Ap0902]|nr:aminodeoxychorismate/anthranilate synthase component II [Flavobacteriaceae bacterium Ap0902]